jgi:hypothetical protein
VGIFAAAQAVNIGLGPLVGGVLLRLTSPVARLLVLDRCAAWLAGTAWLRSTIWLSLRGQVQLTLAPAAEPMGVIQRVESRLI